MFDSANTTLLCDTSTGHPCPLVPPGWRRQVFDAIHNLSHPGMKSSTKLVTARFVWPGFWKDVRASAGSCVPCQHAKVHRHQGMKAALRASLKDCNCVDRLPWVMLGLCSAPQGGPPGFIHWAGVWSDPAGPRGVSSRHSSSLVGCLSSCCMSGHCQCLGSHPDILPLSGQVVRPQGLAICEVCLHQMRQPSHSAAAPQQQTLQHPGDRH